MRSFIVQVQHHDAETEREVTKALRMLMQAVALNETDVKGARVAVLDAIAPVAQPPGRGPQAPHNVSGDVVK